MMKQQKDMNDDKRSTSGIDSSISIPCHWNSDVVNKIIPCNKDIGITPVTEIYGATATGGPLGHGRAPESVVNTSSEDAIKFRDFLRSVQLDFTYLLNAPYVDSVSGTNAKIDDYLNWVIKELKPDAVTISSIELARRVRAMSDELPIHISTIAGVRTAADLEKFNEIRPNRIVPHHDCGKRWNDLKNIAEYCANRDIGIEMLSTESCLLGCSQRTAHYKHLARQNKDSRFHVNCNARKMAYPREFLMAGGFIRPEDMAFYAEKGVSVFKISGRSKPPEWLPEVALAYQRGSFDGNIIRILGIDPSLKAEEWIYIDNKSLDGFIEKYPQSGKHDEEIIYCDEWMQKLYREGKFRVSDGTEYHMENGEFVIKTPGYRTTEIIHGRMK